MEHKQAITPSATPLTTIFMKKIFASTMVYVGVTTLSLLLMFNIYSVDENSGLMLTKTDVIIGCIANLFGLAAAAYSFILNCPNVRSWEKIHAKK